ncbi:MAG: pre-peptidase C-terminal domain-containing protein [Thermoanaerobaculia bacterium]|nr:pre-peptidase C-terminal domain-containing protein [Thermoanaerobaculia bacterium]
MFNSRWQIGRLSFALAAFLGVSAATLPARADEFAPPLDRQLSQHGIRKGTALEKLVIANQDFKMLRADERADTGRIPGWLKVYWRKNHPEARYSAQDPTGGYPHVIKEVLEWMLSHQDLRPGLPEPDRPSAWYDIRDEGDGEPPAPAANRGEEVNATVGTNQRISGAQTSSRSESDIRINYWNPNYIIAGSNNISASGFQAQFWSTDGGATWGQTTLPNSMSDSMNSDPTVDWQSDNTAWSSTLGIVGSTLKLRVYKSTNFGQTWTYDATPSGSQTNVDKQMMWIDHSATSTYKNNIYLIWHDGSPAYMTRRNASGWLASPIKVSGTETTGTAIGSDVKTNGYGDVFGMWPDTGSRGIYVVKSTDGGATYGAPVKIATTYDSYDIGVPSFNGRRLLIYVTAGAYRTASKNNVYAIWADLSGETGCTTASNEPGSSTTSACKTRIWFARSTNGGTTWGAPVKINNQSGKNDQFNPWLAVDETNGRISVMYYDTVNDANRKKTDVYYQSSTDDGATWSTAQKVTTAMTDETVSGADTGNQYGDYNGLTGNAGLFLPSWTDRRNNAKEEIWTAKITEGSTPVTYTISGSAGTASATVTAGSASATSDASNNYTISGLAAGTYTVTPSKSGCTFSPASASVTVGPNATGINFTASCTAPTYTISGNAGTTGVSLTAGTASATSDASGNYTLSGLLAGTFTVTPSKSGCTFTPASASVTVGPNATGVNFTAACGGGDLQLTSGVTVNGESVAQGAWKYSYIVVPSGATSLTFATTNATGDVDIYTQSGAKPTSSSYVCRPYSSSGNETCTATNPAAGTWYLGVYGYAAGSYSVTGTVVTGTTTYTISGSAGTSGALLTAGSKSATSDASNNYTITGLSAGTYTVTPSKSGCTFSPTSRSVSVGPNATGITFTATCGTGGTTQILANAGFESGAVSWTGTSGVITNSTSRTPRTGSYYAWLNGNGTTTTETLYQQVAIPSTATAATLSFYLKIDTAETTTSTAYDKLQVQIRNSSGTVLATLATYSNLNKSTSYALKSFNLLSYKGQTIRVYFLGTEDSSLQTSFLIDDTSLSVTTP